MARCIALARASIGQGELPFAALVCKNGGVVAEATNRVAREGDVTRHAELLALSDAQKKAEVEAAEGLHALLGRGALSHVRLSDPRNGDQPRGFCPQVAGHGRLDAMESFLGIHSWREPCPYSSAGRPRLSAACWLMTLKRPGGNGGRCCGP